MSFTGETKNKQIFIFKLTCGNVTDSTEYFNLRSEIWVLHCALCVHDETLKFFFNL